MDTLGTKSTKSLGRHVSYSTVKLVQTFDDDYEESLSYKNDNDNVEEEDTGYENEEIQLRRKVRKEDLQRMDDLNDDEFVTCIDDIITERKHLQLENRVFENFLRSNEPGLLAGLNQAHQSIKELEETSPLLPLTIDEPTSEIEIRQFSTMYTKAYVYSNRGPRINISQRTDLVLRDIEVMQESLTDFIQKSKHTKFRLNAEIEESAKRLEDVKKVREDFEQTIVIDAIDPITQRIPAEKFIWYMQEWLKTRRLTTEKLRLRNNSLKIQYSKLKSVLMQKAELGESVQEVDFEQYRIANQHLLEKIDQKNNHLLELKRINGKANLNVAKHKNYLQNLLNKLRSGKNAIEEISSQKREHELELKISQRELNEAKVKHKDVLHIIENYRVPDVSEYVDIKARLNELSKIIKTMQRKQNILNIILNSQTKIMMNLTGERKIKLSWFKKGVTDQDLDDYNYDFFNDEDYMIDISKRKLNVQENEFDIFTVLDK